MAEVAGRTSGVVATAIITVAVALYAFRRLRKPEERERLAEWARTQRRRPLLGAPLRAVDAADRRVLRPVLRAASGPARFARDRLLPGRLGIELTSVLVAAGVGLYVYGLYVDQLTPDPRLLTPLDRLVASATIASLPLGPLVDAARVVTAAGSVWMTGALALAAGVWLAVRRRFAEALALAGGWIVVVATVHLTKAIVDRPRPVAAFVDVETSSYPSAHAAQALTLVALGLVVARRAPGWVRPAAVVLAAVALAALVGLTRVYLRAHHLSDVAGGWGLGAGVFGLAAAIAIVAGRLAATGDGDTLPARGKAR